MKFFTSTFPLVTIMSALSPSIIASPTPESNNLVARDVCGDGYPGFTRRIGSGCKASNGVNQFCSCDRTNIAKCVGGKWTDGKDCAAGGQTCFAREDGAKAGCL